MFSVRINFVWLVLDTWEYMDGGAAGMKVLIRLRRQELFWSRMVLTIFACYRFCLEGFQNHSLTRLAFNLKNELIFFFYLQIMIFLPPHNIHQALKKISKFVKTNILPGAIAEVGLLCCACVHSNPEEAVVYIVEPILSSVISSLNGTPITGFGGRGNFESAVSSKVIS